MVYFEKLRKRPIFYVVLNIKKIFNNLIIFSQILVLFIYFYINKKQLPIRKISNYNIFGYNNDISNDFKTNNHFFEFKTQFIVFLS